MTSDADGLSSWQAPAGTPSGGIIMYSGAWNFDGTGLGTGSLAGWALCNGNNGTPNLSDRFVMGTVTSSNLGATGGVNSYSLAVSQLPAHTHSISSSGGHSHDLYIYSVNSNAASSLTFSGSLEDSSPSAYSNNMSTAGAHDHGGATGSTGSGGSIDNRPAYLILAFIMKI